MMDSARIGVEAARGIFLGAAIGDALGWPQELRGGLKGGKAARESAEPKMAFRDWMRSGGHWSRRYDDPVRAGEYSDDTQLFMATARACLVGDDWWRWLVEVELPTWPLYQRGGGGAVLTAARSWAAGRPPWEGDNRSRKRYADAGANGVAMRVAPHIFWSNSPKALVARVFRDGIATHGHPRALVGALTYASVLHYAASSGHTLEFGELVDAASTGLVPSSEVVELLPDRWGDTGLFCSSWDATNIEMAQLLDDVKASLEKGAVSPPTATLERLGCTRPDINGAGTVTAAGAIYLAARFASRPSGGLVAAAFLRGGDTDTLASMAGAVLGSIHGTEWTNGLADLVQDRDYLTDLAQRTAQRRTEKFYPPSASPVTAQRRLVDMLASGSAPALREFPDGRKAAVELLEPLAGQQEMHRATLRLEDGQTVFIDVDVKANSSQAASDTIIQRAGQQHPVAHDEVDEASSSSAPPSREQRGTVAGIMLQSADLSQCAAFYAKVLGVELSIRDRMLRIAPWLTLRETDRPTMQAAGAIALSVPDLDAVMMRLNADPSSRQGDTIHLRDPDGRFVLVDQAKGGSSAAEIVGGELEVVEEKAGEFRIQLTTANGETKMSRRSYESKADAERSMKTMKTAARFGVFMESAAEMLQRRKQ